MADQLNRLQPDTRWRSVGEIVRHLYLVKLREDSGYDVLTFSTNLALDNPSARDAMFYVRKQETDGPKIKDVRVDGSEYPYKIYNGYLNLTIPIAAGNTRSVLIEYDNDLQPFSVDVAKTSTRIYLLRTASDIRDIAISRYAPTAWFVALYHKYEITDAEVIVCAASFTLFCALAAWLLWRVLNTSSRAKPVIVPSHVQGERQR